MKSLRYVSLLLLSLWSNAHAAEVSVRFQDSTYYLSAEFEVVATSERVMEVLTDFENIAELNPAIIESEILHSPTENGLRVKTVIEDCILFFCKQIARVEDIHQEGNQKLEAFIVPMLSDLRSGDAVWLLNQDSNTTLVKYDAHMQPKFWIPPVIRSYLLKKKFKKRVNETVQRLQKIASREE